MSRYVRQVLALRPAGLLDLVVISGLAVVAEIGVRTRPLPQVASWFRVRLTGDPGPPTGWKMNVQHRRRRRVVEMLARHWPLVDRSGLCLRRSLLIGWILRERDPLLRIGVARADGTITAHAWLELEGGQIGADGVHQPLSFGGAAPTDPVEPEVGPA